MLDLASWLPQAEQLALGERRRCDHDCGGGRTLTVEHKDEGYSAWCYRCSDKGWKPHPRPSLQERIAKLNRQQAEDTAAEASAAPPKPTAFDPRDWPLEARVWLYKAGFSNDTIQKHGFYYTAALNRVVLPIFQGGSIVYWQARGFDPDRPKYLNPQVDKPLACYGERGAVVLTEDVLSAARVAGAGHRGIAVLGTSLSDRAVGEIVSAVAQSALPRDVVIWLDGDRAGRKGRAKIAAQVALAGLRPRLIRTPRDPKEYSRYEIEEFIQSALR